MQDEDIDTSHVEIDDALMIDDDDISDDDDDDDDDDHEVNFCKLNAPDPLFASLQTYNHRWLLRLIFIHIMTKYPFSWYQIICVLPN